VPNVQQGVKGFLSVPVAKRFWSKVKKTSGCWLWVGSTKHKDPSRAYGEIRVSGRKRPATQVMWELKHGKPWPKGMLACHTCDTPLCVHPDHIFVGTHKDNSQDALKKGRLVVAGNRLRSHCKRGHAFAGDNLIVRPNGHRICRTCKDLRNKARYRPELAAALASGDDLDNLQAMGNTVDTDKPEGGGSIRG
jgi:hypothetical protein